MLSPIVLRTSHRGTWTVKALTLFVALLLVPIAGTATPWRHAHADPNVLWHFVHDQCAPKASRGVYPPLPCVEVNLPHNTQQGYVVFKDRAGRYQYLVLPLAHITGIESPELVAPDAPDYVADAWTARMYVEAALHKRVPRDMLGLVVNSARGRSQNQLHIHIDCIAPAVHAELQRLQPGITRHWAMLPIHLPDSMHGRAYMARWIAGATLTVNPFRLLAHALRTGDSMANHSLVVVGARDKQGRPGFILLSTRADPATGNNGNSDNLQDTTCTLASPPSSTQGVARAQ
ncbi:CDP-diacylglycerol diphosphatase [Oleiagrimonas sp.]|jgi:CDP-diacylglycerol pyrophosphatase|uniref:CDP-diacylglycerol diphosphatase n=1 Tax=Oleiagrimonas sp. TaxID=2010330 RepID=UPI0026238939|nr:CDP-diacylglycerol diphosphatase [Oleiagrimonas sp.]MDA3913898.1 CDP-diacylglycerol diphosphatase [Oleiagrimonas sp.]